MKLTRRLAAVELTNGTVHTDVRILHTDVMRYQRTAETHNWPRMTVKDGTGTVPHVNYEETFVCWAALKRLGLYEGTWETFRDSDCADLTVETEEVDPTPPESMPPAVNDSASSSPITSPDTASVG